MGYQPQGVDLQDKRIVPTLYQDLAKTNLLTMPAATDTLVALALAQELLAKTLTSPTIQGTVLAGAGLTMPAFTAGGDINIGANKIVMTNIDLLEHDVHRVKFQRGAAYKSLLIATLWPCSGDVDFGNAADRSIITANVDDKYVSLKARRNAQGTVEIARFAGAAEPRFGHTLPLNLRSAGALTIAAGVITIGVAAAKAWYSVDTEDAAATDDLDTISGGATGDIIVIKAANSARDVVVKHGTGNILCNALADFTLDNANDVWVGIFDGTNWLEIARSSNGV